MKEIKANIEAFSQSFPIAIIVSTFNEEITRELKNGAIARLNQLGFHDKDLTLIEVPGAIEIPLIANILAKKNQVQAIIALGAVIRGETSHYDYVCDQVSQGCQRVMLDHNVPVIFGVLTTENEEQAWERLGGKHGHKGCEAADCAVMMHLITQQIS